MPDARVTLDSLFEKYNASSDARMRYTFLTASLIDESEVVEKFLEEDLCVNALAHPQKLEIDKCKECSQEKSVSQWACTTCSFQEGLCSVCKKVVNIKKLDIPDKGVSVCLALLTNKELMETCFPSDTSPQEEVEEAKENHSHDSHEESESDSEEDEDIPNEAIFEQIHMMLDFFFNPPS